MSDFNDTESLQRHSANAQESAAPANQHAARRAFQTAAFTQLLGVIFLAVPAVVAPFVPLGLIDVAMLIMGATLVGFGLWQLLLELRLFSAPAASRVRATGRAVFVVLTAIAFTIIVWSFLAP